MLISRLAEQVPEDLAKYIRWGATPQNLMDKASVLELSKGLAVVKRQLREAVSHLRRISEKYRDTKMFGCERELNADLH